MKISLAYGKGLLDIQLPRQTCVDVVEPSYTPGLPDQTEAVRRSLENPVGLPSLPALAKKSRKTGIVFSDITRATPYEVILPPLLKILEASETEIIFFNAAGTHRPNTREELVSILGEEVLGKYRIIQNDCEKAGLYSRTGLTSGGNEVFILSEFLSCDLKILTGFIEPHFFAGFSGGGKAVMPGLSALSTTLHNHGAANMDHPKAMWGITAGNPVWEDITEAAETPARDSWQAQILCRICEKHRVYFYSHNLSEQQIRSAIMTPAHDIGALAEEMAEKHPKGTFHICVLPRGPLTIPYVHRLIDKGWGS